MGEATKVTVHCAGRIEGDMVCDGWFSRSGDISDGVAIRDTDGKSTAGWVMSFADLEKLYKAAREYRERYAAQIEKSNREWEKMMAP
jgi:hypothetical protein